MTTHAAVCHAWAHATGKSRKGFNMFYEGDTIYSYGHHFAIARRIHSELYLFTTRSRSVSTSKHKTYTWRAIPTNATTLLVDNPAVAPSVKDWEYDIAMAKDFAAKAMRAHKRGDWHVQSAQRHLDNANELNERFDLGKPTATFDTIGVHMADIQARLEAQRLVEVEREREYNAKLVIEQAERRAQWQAGEHVRFYGRDEQGRAYLRIRGAFLETSQGVSVPLAEAVEVFKIMEHCHKYKGVWPDDFAWNRPMRVGDYKVDRIDADGTLHAGCHVIGWEESKRVYSRQAAVPYGWDKIEGGGHNVSA